MLLRENASGLAVPAVLYHGSKRKFSKFDLGYFGQTDDGYYGVGVYLAPSVSHANDYGWWIYKVHLENPKPFFLSDESAMGDCAQARKDLAKLPEYTDVAPNTTVPDGYEVVPDEDQGNGWREPVKGWRVQPIDNETNRVPHPTSPSGTWWKDDLRWGSIHTTAERAVIHFNDEDKFGYNSGPGTAGWTSQLLKKVGRKAFAKVLAQNGYNCLCLYDKESGEPRVSEVMVVDPDIIVVDEVFKQHNEYGVYEDRNSISVVRTTSAKIWKSQMANSNMCYDVLKSATSGDVNGELLLYMIQQNGQSVGWMAVDSDGPTLLLIYVKPNRQQQGIGLKALQLVFKGQPFEAEAVSDEGEALIRKYRSSDLVEHLLATTAKVVVEAQLALPTVRKNRVWHVGSLDKPRHAVGGAGNEGSGLPVSEHPEDWRSIARLGNQKVWELTKSSGLFVDVLRTLKNKRTLRMIHEWAIAGGLAVASPVYRVHFDNEDGDDVFFEFTDEEEAKAEADFEEGRRLEVVSSGLKATSSMQRWFRAFSGHAMPSALLNDMLVFRYAEQSGCDGVWWNARCCSAECSAWKHLSSCPAGMEKGGSYAVNSIVTAAHYLAAEDQAERWFSRNGKLLYGDDNRYELAFTFYVDQHGKLCTTPLARGEGAEVEIPPVPEGCIEIGSMHTHCGCVGELSDHDMEQGQAIANKLGHDYLMFVAGPSNEDEGVMLSSETFEPETLTEAASVDPWAFNKVQRVTPQWLLRETTPFDYDSWKAAFASIESNHVACDPAYWERFLRSTKARIRKPVLVWNDEGNLRVTQGHHRVWSAVTQKLPNVPVVFLADYQTRLIEAVSPEEDYNVEKDFAAKVMAGKAQLKDFPYYKDYASTVDAEHAATGGGSIIFVGGGPVPISCSARGTARRSPCWSWKPKPRKSPRRCWLT